MNIMLIKTTLLRKKMGRNKWVMRCISMLAGFAGATTVLGCENRRPVEIRYPDAKFNSAKWQLDSVGCSGYRMNLYESVAANAGFFKNKSPQYLQRLLGAPSIARSFDSKESVYCYVVSCLFTPQIGKDTIIHEIHPLAMRNAYKLCFAIEKDKCTGVSVEIP